MPLGQQAQPEILGDVRVLVLVHQDVLEPVLVVGQYFGVFGEDRQVVQQQVAEIGGVQRAQPVLVVAVEIDQATAREIAGIRRRDLVRCERTIFPALDHAHEDACGPALVVDVLRLEQLLEQPHLVVGIEDGEIVAQADKFGVAAQDARTERMEGAEPDRLCRPAHEVCHPLAHFAGRLVREGDRKHLVGTRAPEPQEMGKPRRQHTGLSRACARKHQDRPVQRLDSLALGRVELVQVRRRCSLGKRGNPRFFDVKRVGHRNCRLYHAPARSRARVPVDELRVKRVSRCRAGGNISA